MVGVIGMADPKPAVLNSRLMRALRHQQTDATPIWLMRQAGRYMPEYRKLRERYGILEIIKTPELACEVTLQPVRAFDLDAAIIFADILPPLEGMGLNLQFVKGDGPVIDNPVRKMSDIENLRVQPPEEALWFTLKAIQEVQNELSRKMLPLFGFSGAPYTLACYAIEGGTSRNFLRAKNLMLDEPDAWHLLMEKLAKVVGEYLFAQVRAGAQVLQVFDTWIGELTPTDYKERVLPYTKKSIEIAREANVPIIYFGTNTGGLLELMCETGCDIIGIDWRINLSTAWDRLGNGVGIQGNLDPASLFASWEEVRRRAQFVLDQARGRPGHIFNLGHGILPETPVDNVGRLVDFVHEATVQ